MPSTRAAHTQAETPNTRAPRNWPCTAHRKKEPPRRMSTFVTVVAPAGSSPGQQVPIVTTAGQHYFVVIPSGVQPGQSFQAPLPPPTATVVTGTPVANNHVHVDMRPKYTVEVEESSMGSNRAASCTLVFFGIAVAVASMFLLSSISYYFDTVAVPCTRCSAFGGCWLSTCYYTNHWIKTQPISVDALPYRNATGDSNEANGDGSPDNYALIVACVCGTIGGMMAACFSGPAVIRRAAGGKSFINVGLALSFLLLVASIVCLSIQMIANKDQWVYNAFCGVEGSKCSEPYQHITGSLASHWANDQYYSFYGRLVYFVYSITIVLAFFELIAFIARKA